MGKITKFSDVPPLIDCNFGGSNYRLERFLVYLRELEEGDGLNLNPDFQREHVWTEAQQTAYIEFFLRGGVSANSFYFNYPSWKRPVEEGDYDEFVIVDGKQRIQAISAFIGNKIPAFGSLFCEFTDKLSNTTNSVTFYVNSLQTKKEVLEWYLQMNGGGTPHSKAELDRVQAMIEKLKPKKTKRA